MKIIKKKLVYKDTILLINSKYVKELSKYINIAQDKGLNYRVVSRKEGSTDVILVIASSKAIQNNNDWFCKELALR